MRILEWNNSLYTGLDNIDNHHRHLIEILNRSYMAYKYSNCNISPIIDELIEYTTYHFNAEELIMYMYFYPKLNNHKEEHIKFLNKVMVFKNDLKLEKQTLSAEIFTFLAQWVTQHIMESDVEMGKFIVEKKKTEGYDFII